MNRKWKIERLTRRRWDAEIWDKRPVSPNAVVFTYGWSDLWQAQQDAKAGAFHDFPVRRFASPESRRREPSVGGKFAKRAWPKSLADRVRLIDETLRTTPGPHTAPSLAKQFSRASEKDVEEILETLAALGRTASVTSRHITVNYISKTL